MTRWLDRLAVVGAVVGGVLLAATGVLVLLGGWRIGVSPWALIVAGVALAGVVSLAARRRGWDGCEAAAAGAMAGLAVAVAMAAAGAVAAKALGHRLIAALVGAGMAAVVLAGGHGVGAVVAVGSVALTGRDITLTGGQAGGASPRGPPAAATGRVVPHKPRTLLSDLQFTRRVDVFGPHNVDAVAMHDASEAEISTMIQYSRGAEGALAFRVPVIAGADPAATRLGPWEQLTYYALCDIFRRRGTDPDGWLRIPSLRYFGCRVLGRAPTGREGGHLVAAIRRLATITICEGSEQFVYRKTRAGVRVERGVVEHMYHLLAEVEIVSGANKGKRGGALAPWAIRVRMSAVVADRLKAGLVATLASAAVYRLGPGNGGGLRLYAYLRSQHHMNCCSAVVVEQIVRPAASWGLASKPAKFRKAIQHMVDEITAGDPGLRLRVAPASQESGGWMLTWGGAN